MNRLLDDIQRRLARAMRSFGKSVEAEVVKAAPNVTGNLRNSILNSAVHRRGDKYVIEISMVKYGRFVNEGTGIFGATKKRIFPVQSKALNTPYGPRKSIKGMEGRRFVEEGLSRVMRSGELVQIIEKAFR